MTDKPESAKRKKARLILLFALLAITIVSTVFEALGYHL